jgi:hypothetical protein
MDRQQQAVLRLVGVGKLLPQCDKLTNSPALSKTGPNGSLSSSALKFWIIGTKEFTAKSSSMNGQVRIMKIFSKKKHQGYMK